MNSCHNELDNPASGKRTTYTLKGRLHETDGR